MAAEQRVSGTFIELGPYFSAAGHVRLPGSKSISNRTLLLAALAKGTTEIREPLVSEDTERMLEALRALGVEIDFSPQSGRCRVTGCGGAFPVKSAELFLGNAGTAFRPLTAALAFNGGHYRLTGVARMHERPIADLVDALREAGAEIRYLGKEGFPPLEILPARGDAGRTVGVRGEVSSQFLSSLLMALPLCGGGTVQVQGDLISKPYVELTLNLMARFGVVAQREAWSRFEIARGASYRTPGTIFVEGDASSASYFLAAGAIGGGPVRVEGVGRASIQGDIGFAEALRAMGAQVEMSDNTIEVRAPDAGPLRAFDLDLNHIPDAAMTLAVTALFAQGESRLRNVASWRVKETDRIAAMATELRKVGAQVEEGSDYLLIAPPAAARLTPHAAIDTYDDHRIAMCFSLVSLGGVPVRINDPQCVAKTFPDYFERFASITRVPVIAIDGPSGSGKGTIAQRVAQALRFHYLDSGALYRLVALHALRSKVPLEDIAQVTALAQRLPVQFQGEEIFLDGTRVGDAIRTEQISEAASKVAAIPSVRQALMRRQRAFRNAPGLVAEGRDMGSVVFPDATLKVFLTASAEARAERRYKQLIDKGLSATLSTLLRDIEQRDARDSGRSVAPLQKSVGAQVLDTTGLTIDQAVERVLGWSHEALRKAPSR
jgi:3-phosphoshikimate 1-carboxyvinyltransferase